MAIQPSKEPNEGQQVDLFEILSDKIGNLEEEPMDDLGDRIEDEFDKRYGCLANTDRKLALLYLSSDYRRARYAAAKYIGFAQSVEPESPEYKEHLDIAGYFLYRASRDVHRIYKISLLEKPKIDLDSLQRLKVAYFYAEQFPTHCRELIRLNSMLENAVRRENFELAAKLRNQISAVASAPNRRYKVSLKRVVYEYLEKVLDYCRMTLLRYKYKI